MESLEVFDRDVTDGNFSRKNAEKAYREALKYLGKVVRFHFIGALEINGPSQPGQDGNRDTPKTSKHTNRTLCAAGS